MVPKRVPLLSEMHVVVEVKLAGGGRGTKALAGRTRGPDLPRAWGGPGAGAVRGLAGVAGAGRGGRRGVPGPLATAAEHQQGVRMDFGGVAVLAGRVGPLAGLQPALDEHFVAFDQVAMDRLQTVMPDGR